jgi:hypothetical protein
MAGFSTSIVRAFGLARKTEVDELPGGRAPRLLHPPDDREAAHAIDQV